MFHTKNKILENDIKAAINNQNWQLPESFQWTSIDFAQIPQLQPLWKYYLVIFFTYLEILQHSKVSNVKKYTKTINRYLLLQKYIKILQRKFRLSSYEFNRKEHLAKSKN